MINMEILINIVRSNSKNIYFSVLCSVLPPMIKGIVDVLKFHGLSIYIFHVFIPIIGETIKKNY